MAIYTLASGIGGTVNYEFGKLKFSKSPNINWKKKIHRIQK